MCITVVIKIMLLLIAKQTLGLNNEKPGSYNSIYPLTNPVQTNEGLKFHIGMISDFHIESKSIWTSDFKKGFLIWDSVSKYVNVTWDDSHDVVLKLSSVSGKQELKMSELITYNGKLYALNKKGTVFEIRNDEVKPWKTIKNEDGRLSKNFTSDWAAVKNDNLFVGGMVTEAASIKTIESLHWARILTSTGNVTNYNWRTKYSALSYAVGYEAQGFMRFGAVAWSDVRKRWFVMPSECSKEHYDPSVSSDAGCNILLTANEAFSDIEVIQVGKINLTRKFTSFKFVPTSEDSVIVALESSTVNDKPATYIMAFSLYGQILLPETKISDKKYVGIEFL